VDSGYTTILVPNLFKCNGSSENWKIVPIHPIYRMLPTQLYLGLTSLAGQSSHEDLSPISPNLCGDDIWVDAPKRAAMRKIKWLGSDIKGKLVARYRKVRVVNPHFG
jgi:hypothetical protein